MNFDVEYKRFRDLFNNDLAEYLNSIKNGVPERLFDAVSYSVVDGGKRVRPVLCYATAEMLGISLDEVKYYALAIEFIHSYSLVHDDLPSMDNDYFRRGKLSTHKKFGEALVVLAGDSLLNLAIETALKKPSFSEKDISALKILFYCSGIKGMIKGQVLDIQNERNNYISQDLLNEIFINKTSKLIVAPMLIASLLADKAYFDQINEFGSLLGILFQITDDILDVEGSLLCIGKTPNKDAVLDKMTAVKVYGLDGEKEKANDLYLKCKRILESIPRSEFLSSFTDKIYYRKS